MQQPIRLRVFNSERHSRRTDRRLRTGELGLVRGWPPANHSANDSLYLNVYSPANATRNSAFPVRVWLYGGSNTDGGIANPFYDGCNVAAHNAIMVSINYRLGPLGYLMLRDSGFMGNQALKDQILALQWVQENIAAFGGDPVWRTPLYMPSSKLTRIQKKVMLHGQSAGARDAFTLATLSEASELFSSAIFESGAGRETTTCSNAQRIGQSFAAALNCSADDVSLSIRTGPSRQ